MFRSLAYALLAILLLHLLLAGAFVGYMGATNRLSKQRLNKAVEIFKPTIAEHKQQVAEAQAQAKKQAKKQQQALRLKRAAEGPKTVEQRLSDQQQHEAVTAQRIQRLEREKQDILRQVTQSKDAVTKQEKGIEAARKAFNQRVEAFKKKQANKDFQHAVKLIEQLQAKQAKRVFQDMLGQGKEQTVISYLAAMSQRQAGKILGQFNTPADIPQARRLIEGLRQRGEKLADQPLPMKQNKAPGPNDKQAEDAAA